ncbi:MAG: tetratricopeptide repeat protein [Pseudomonadota bacterium]
MKSDDDIAALLPEPPPHAPAPREAAIGAALRRFDGDAAPQHAARPPSTRKPLLNRPQIGLLVSAALVAVIGLPMAWVSVPHEAPRGNARPATDTAFVETTQAVSTGAQSAPQEPPKVVISSNDAVQQATPPAAYVPPPGIVPPAIMPPGVVSPPPPAVVTPQPMADRAVSQKVPDQLARTNTPTVQARAPAPSPPLARYAEESDDSSIVVTGAYRARARPVPRGDWNACTVSDPARSLRGCQGLISPGRKGVRGQADALVADGLAQAWLGDDHSAIATFDRAVEIDPRSSIAHLNRGLAYRNRGNLDRAIADLDLAIKYAPGEARGYYNRSLLLRQRGDIRAAKSDEGRAIELDSRYAEILR